MPRPRVRDEDRKRVAQACDTCKRRKEKCDGQHPCLLCRRRGREPECTFTDGASARRGSNKSNKNNSTSTASLTPSSSQPRVKGHAQRSSLDPLLMRDSITAVASSKPYLASDTTTDFQPVESPPSAASIRHMTLNNAYQPSLTPFDDATNADREIAIESLLTLSSAPTTQTRPSSVVAANQSPVAAAATTTTTATAADHQPFKFSSQPAGTSPDHQHAPAFHHQHSAFPQQHGEESRPKPPSLHQQQQQQQSAEPRPEPDPYSRAPVPKLARLLKDGLGKFVFVGDSSNLAFLQNIRRLVKSEIGESGLTSDPLRHAMVENLPPRPPPPTSSAAAAGGGGGGGGGGGASASKMRGRTNSHSHSQSPTLRKPSLAEAKGLLRSYALATSGIIDLFDIEDLALGIEKWCGSSGGGGGGHKNFVDTDEEERQQRQQQQQQSGVGDFSASTYYLVLAIGMQLRGLKGGRDVKNVNGGDDGTDSTGVSGHAAATSSSNTAEVYFERGRALVTSSFMDDPSLLTVQSYILIAFYLLTVCRRNGAFMLLGIAVRAAYALGLHRRDISVLFESRERRTRERVWKSLRALDLFMSASLGRPPATSEIDGGSVSWDGKERSYEGVKVEGLDSSAMLRMWFIFERILNEVYCRREIRVQLVDSISRQYRDWTLQLPVGLRTDGLDLKEGEGQSLVKTIGVAHLKMAYYWSIILLTRPFLIFKVSGKIKARKEERRRQQSRRQQPAEEVDAAAAAAAAAADDDDDDDDDDDANKMTNVTTTLSEACIDAALRSVEIATDLIHTPGVPKRLFMVSNSVFVSAMVIGFAIFGEFDRTFPLLSSIDQAIAILSILALHDPSARRYEQISTHLRQAAAEHIRRREEIEAERRSQDINSIFGNPKDGEGERSLAQGMLIPQDVPIGDGLAATDTFFQQEPWQLRFDMQSEGAPILTTSGTLAANGDDTGDDPFDLSRYGIDQAGDADSFAALSGSGVGQPSASEEFPLFSLLTEYDELQDPYSMMLT